MRSIKEREVNIYVRGIITGWRAIYLTAPWCIAIEAGVEE